MVAELIDELKKQGIGIFLIDHDIHQVKNLCDRASVMKNGKLVGTVEVDKVSEDDILGMIIIRHGSCRGDLDRDPPPKHRSDVVTTKYKRLPGHEPGRRFVFSPVKGDGSSKTAAECPWSVRSAQEGTVPLWSCATAEMWSATVRTRARSRADS
jgi:energy-coupling factor transporter ATP-binding protein EcfA2